MRKRNDAVITHFFGLTEELLLLNPLLKKKLIHLDQLQEKYSLSNSQVSILILLSKYHSLTVSEISRRLDMAKPNITPVVERLYRRGLVSREHDDEDRRVVNVAIVPEGEALLKCLQNDLSLQLHEQTQGLSVADLKALYTSIDRMYQILDKL